MRYFVLVVLLGVVWNVPDVLAQSSRTRRGEVAVTVGSACLVTSSACGGGREGMHGAFASFWLTPKTEIGGRVAALTTPDSRGGETRYGPNFEPVLRLEYAVRDQSRLYVLGHIYRHFGSDPRVRLYTGVALGSYFDRMTIVCESPDCEANLARFGHLPAGATVLEKATSPSASDCRA